MKWWQASAAEHLWIEIRREPGIGIDLHCPARNRAGKTDGRYELVRQVRAGDVVFHYNADESRFVGRSVAHTDAIVTGTDYRVPLANFRSIDVEVGLSQIRAVAPQLYSIRDAIIETYDPPYHLPFQWTESPSDIRMMSNYFVRLPREMLKVLFPVSELDEDEGAAPGGGLRRQGGFLSPFKPKSDTQYTSRTLEQVSHRERRHETLVNRCAEWLTAKGFEVGRNAAVDLGMASPPVIIEAKTIGTSWAVPVRQAVSQLYEYRYFRVADPSSSLLLLAERKIPTDWIEYLEQDRGIGVMWPEDDSYGMSPLAQKALT